MNLIALTEMRAWLCFLLNMFPESPWHDGGLQCSDGLPDPSLCKNLPLSFSFYEVRKVLCLAFEVVGVLKVCNLERRHDIKDLELHLRSDFTAMSVPVQLKLPTVYLLGCSTQAAHKLASALSLQHSQDAGSLAVGQKRSEFMLDGSRWCNLLAAQAVTPKMAATTLTSALAAEAAPPGWLGGVSQAVRVHPPPLLSVHLPTLSVVFCNKRNNHDCLKQNLNKACWPEASSSASHNNILSAHRHAVPYDYETVL